jgi:hypothetical protein
MIRDFEGDAAQFKPLELERRRIAARRPCRQEGSAEWVEVEGCICHMEVATDYSAFHASPPRKLGAALTGVWRRCTPPFEEALAESPRG